MIKERRIIVEGFNCTVINFSYATFIYPDFNGNAEFECSSKGYKKLRSYLRTILYFRKLINNERSI